MSLVPLHDPTNGVVVSMHCFEVHQEHLLPENLAYCQELKSRYNDFGYEDLMNTTFAIIPAGRSPGTYRLGEVMSAGAIPVFVARDIVRPFREQFDWSSFSFVFAPDQVGAMMFQTLRGVPPQKLEDMQVGIYHGVPSECVCVVLDVCRPCSGFRREWPRSLSFDM